MASKRKESEGIALLSMYNDEDEDMDDVDEAEENREDAIDNDVVASDSASEDTPQRFQSQTSLPTEDSTPKSERLASLTPQLPQVSLKSPPLPPQPPPSSAPFLDAQRTRKGTLAIVDYAHDETTMSPEAEEGEIISGGRVMFGEELETANGDFQEKTPQRMVQTLTTNTQTPPPQPFEQPASLQSDNSISINGSRIDSKDAGVEEDIMVSMEEQGDADPLDKFLPPPPKVKCSEQLQEKINKFLAYKRAGKSFNAEVRNRKDYRNPDFLLHAVRYQEIDQMGSCFSKEVFDPHGYDKSDYYDELEADMRRDLERKEHGVKKNHKGEFVSGGTQSGIVPAGPKINMPFPGTASDALARDRQNKKSKWDKVDSDQRNPLLPGGQDTVSTVGVNAAMLSAANMGAGYTAFAQQRRKEAEEKKSSEKKLERRS